MTTDNLEVEVKFVVADLAAMQQRLRNAGATLAKPRVFERNLRLDTPDEALRYSGRLLRLRQDTAVRLTFKGETEADATSEAKVREELEVTVSDLDTAVAICQRLGFQPVQVYEKYRTTYQLGSVEVVLDELPIGNFMELEGAEAAIKDAANLLNMDWGQRLLTNYLALMAQTKAVYQLDFDDLTFANFENVDVSLANVIERGM